MLTFVLFSNLLIFIINIFLIIYFHRLRRNLAILADNLNTIEAHSRAKLGITPLIINKYRERTDRFNKGYQRLTWQWKKIKQIVALFRLFYRIYTLQIREQKLI
jgi:hypothetical protein